MKNIKTILLVENNISDILAFEEILKKSLFGHVQLITAPSCQKAFELMHQEPVPNIVFMDITLSGACGLSGVKSFAQSFSNTVLIVTSGNNDDNELQTVIESGAHNYIKKRENSPSLLNHAIQLSYIRNQPWLKEQKSARYYIDFIENTTDIIQSIDEDGSIRYINRAWTDTLKYQKADVIGKNIFQFIHPDSRDSCMTYFRNVLNTRSSLFHEIDFISSDGERVMCEANISVYEHDNKLTTRGIFRNITERKKQDLLLSRIIETSDMVFYSLNVRLDGKQVDETIKYISNKCKEILGLTFEDFKNNPSMWIDSIHPDDREAVLKTSKQLYKSGKAITQIYRFLNHNTQSYIWIEDYACPVVEKDGSINELYGSMKDVTLRKNAKRQLEMSYKELYHIDQLNRALSNNAKDSDVYASILDALKDFSNIQHSRIYTFDWHSKTLKLTAQNINKPVATLIEKKVSINIKKIVPSVKEGSYYFNILKKGEPIITDDREMIHELIIQHSDSYIMQKLGNLVIDLLKIKTFGVLPIVNGNTILGLITFSSTRRLSDEDKKSIQRFIHQSVNMLLQKQKDKMLLDQKLFMEEIMDNMPIDVVVLNEDNKYIFINKTAVPDDAFRKSMIGKTVADFINAQSKNQEAYRPRLNALKEIDKMHKPVTWVEETTDAEGEDLFMMRTLYPVRIGSRNYKAGYGMNVTKLKQYEKEILKNISQLKLAQKIALIGGWEYDRNKRQLKLSDEANDILCIDYKKFNGTLRSFIDMVDDASKEVMLTRIQSLELLDKKDTIEFRIKLPTGHYKDISCNYIFSADNDQVYGTVQDITEQKKIKTILENYNTTLKKEVKEQTRKLQVANEELDAFNYSVSHDLRIPIRGIELFTEVLKSEIQDEKLHEYIEKINVCTHEVNTMIHTLLSFSKYSRSSVKKRTINPEQIINECYTALKQSDHEQSKPALVLDKTLPLYADPDLMKHVFYNLLSNAIKYSGNTQLPTIQIASHQKEDYIEYSIKDNGVGFDPKQASKLFKPFSRLHSSAEFKGNGAGLAIVQRIILNHGGDIWAESSPGNGAVFYFKIPEK